MRSVDDRTPESPVVVVLRSWGLRTLGELAVLPSADLVARLGQRGVLWQAMARGEDVRPLVPDAPEERFESTLDLEWPIEGLEPLSFVLTRLLEPLSRRLERRDRGAAALHVMLRLVSPRSGCSSNSDPAIHRRQLTFPSPLREPRTLRTLALLDLESHPPDAPVDRVTVVIDPTPGRVWQHTLFTRAHPTPEQLSTLLARLGALMGQDRIGRPIAVDSYQPGVFAMKPFGITHTQEATARAGEPRGKRVAQSEASVASSLVSTLHRCRRPVPARVVLENGRPVRVTTDRRGFAGGRVMTCAGPWRTSGAWWAPKVPVVGPLRRSVLDPREGTGPRASGVGVGPLRRSVLDPHEGNGPRASGVGVEPLRRSVLDTHEGNGPRASGVGVGPHAWDKRRVGCRAQRRCRVRIFQDVSRRGGSLTRSWIES